MSYSISVSTVFDAPIAKVYETLCTIDTYVLWNSGMKKVSKSGLITEDMLIEIESIVGGELNRSTLEVVKLIKNKQIEMINNSRAVSYHISYYLLPESPDRTELVCMLQFTFKSLTLDLARANIEARAEDRIKGNMEGLRALLES